MAKAAKDRGPRKPSTAIPPGYKVLAYDVELRRPGCVLLQVALGGSSALAHLWPSELWLTYPSDDLRPRLITPEQAKQLAKLDQKIHVDLVRRRL